MFLIPKIKLHISLLGCHWTVCIKICKEDLVQLLHFPFCVCVISNASTLLLHNMSVLLNYVPVNDLNVHISVIKCSGLCCSGILHSIDC